MNKVIRFIPLILFVVLAIVLYRGLSLNPTELPSALVGKTLPSFQLPTLLDEKKIVTEKDIQGDIVLLNVWGTWCVYCKYEHPFLLDIAKSGRFKLYGINLKDDRQAAIDWLKQYNTPYEFSIFDEEGTLGLDLGVTGAPETFVIDKNGIIRMRYQGPIDATVWQQQFVPLLSQLEQQGQ
jgi:cytochrome c biogenesis protein CcmG/thiol:disulfide interchange protein DsbE